MRISSADNPLYRRLHRLSESPRECREAGRTIVEGIHLIDATLAARIPVLTLVERGEVSAAPEWINQVRSAVGSSARIIELAPALYDRIAPVEHGVGVLAEIEIPRTSWPRSVDEDTIYLDGIQDAGNVGTLVRTAAAAGVRHVVAGPRSAYAWSPKAMRAAMGAHFRVCVHDGLAVETVSAAFTGTVLAADVRGEDLYAADWGRGPALWLFGSEGQGLSPEAVALSNHRLRIPLSADVESLNVAAAAAVCLFEQARRRRA